LRWRARVGCACALLRVVQSFIHPGSNDVLRRFHAFALSWLVLLAY